MGMSLATTFVLTLASAASCVVYHGLLSPLDITYLRTISFIVVIAAVVQFTEIMVRQLSPLLHQVLGIFLPLITTNCAVLGVALLSLNRELSFFHTTLYGLARQQVSRWCWCCSPPCVNGWPVPIYQSRSRAPPLPW